MIFQVFILELCANVTVLKGLTIGETAFVAAVSMVASALPPNVVACGMPTKILKEIDARQPGAKQ